jgi:hypothetical protein
MSRECMLKKRLLVAEIEKLTAVLQAKRVDLSGIRITVACLHNPGDPPCESEPAPIVPKPKPKAPGAMAETNSSQTGELCEKCGMPSMVNRGGCAHCTLCAHKQGCSG